MNDPQLSGAPAPHPSIAARNVPRFTSYPTALHFSPEVGPAQHAAWIGALADGRDLSVYVHVPFCHELCLYCGCQTSVVRHHGPVAAYAALLGRELDLIAPHLRGRPRLSHLHFGGGTPTTLRPGEFAAIIARLRAEFAFAPDAEIAVEIDPRSMTPVEVGMLAAGGVTRASLGVQSFDDDVQRTVRREQSYALTSRLVDWLRHAGIEALNFDLMYGLPHQTVENVVASAEAALSLDPDRIALFGYAHVPWQKRHQALLPEAAMADAQGRQAQFEAAAAAIERAGYVRIGLDHFARPEDPMTRMAEAGTLRRNFQGYTTDTGEALLGLGASAISSFPGGFAQNQPSVPAYREALVRGTLATARGVRVTAQDRLRAAIIERLMCEFTVDLDAICRDQRADSAMLAEDMVRLEPLLAAGLASRRGGRLSVAPEARHLVRVVSAAFDARSQGVQQRYSRAV